MCSGLILLFCRHVIQFLSNLYINRPLSCLLVLDLCHHVVEVGPYLIIQ